MLIYNLLIMKFDWRGRSFCLMIVLMTWIGYFNCSKIDLPDYPNTKVKLYSGYLKTESSEMHYLFAKAAENKDALVLWLNGEFGCSSLLGFANLNGPAVLDPETNKFVSNQFSWSEHANILYLDNLGAGFSKYNEPITEQIILKSTFEALLQFYSEFPEHSSTNFFIAGEGLSGTLGPKLAFHILEYNRDKIQIQLKGLIIGNGIVDLTKRLSYFMDYAFFHGFYSIESRDSLLKSCGNSREYNFNDTKCKKAFVLAYNQIGDVNLIDIYRDCLQTSQSKRDNFHNVNYFVDQILDNSLKSSGIEKGDLDFKGCDNTGDASAYFNRSDVKNALNINSTTQWKECIKGSHLQINEEKTTEIYKKLMKNNIQILMYSGNLDAAVPHNQMRDWIGEKLDLTMTQHHNWNIATDRTAGRVTIYNNFTYYLVHGLGHYSSNRKAELSFIFSTFINQFTKQILDS